MNYLNFPVKAVKASEYLDIAERSKRENTHQASAVKPVALADHSEKMFMRNFPEYKRWVESFVYDQAVRYGSNKVGRLEAENLVSNHAKELSVALARHNAVVKEIGSLVKQGVSVEDAQKKAAKKADIERLKEIKSNNALTNLPRDLRMANDILIVEKLREKLLVESFVHEENIPLSNDLFNAHANMRGEGNFNKLVDIAKELKEKGHLI